MKDDRDNPCFYTDVGTCARCQADHQHILFHQFEYPADRFTHWAICPTTGEPILMTVKPETE